MWTVFSFGLGNMASGRSFWGLWLLPCGLLVLKSRAIPRFFGFALILGCCSYLAWVIVPVFWDEYADSMIG